MKKQTFSKFGHAVRNTFLAGIFLMSLSSSAQAQDKESQSVNPVEIKYLGTIDDQPVFQLDFDNAYEKNVKLSITDENGLLLYGGRTNEKKFSKKFKFEKAGIDPVKLTFTLTTGKEKQSQVFEINTKVWTVKDVVVTRL
jgi:hypothetical protein